MMTGRLLLCITCWFSLSVQSNAEERIRIASLNCLFVNEDVAGTVELIRRSEADVVCLQEVSPALESGLPRAMQEWLPYSWFEGDPRRYPASRVGILSKYSLSKWTFVDPVPGGVFGTLIVQVDDPAGRFQVANVHLCPLMLRGQPGVKALLRGMRDFEAVHKREVEAVLDSLSDELPAFVVGDFNSFPGTAAPRKLMEEGWFDACAEVHDRPDELTTWDGRSMRIPLKYRIDYVFRPTGFEATRFRTYWSELSDHALLQAEFRRGAK